MRVLHPDLALFHAQDAVRHISKLEDVALEALYRKILVDGAYKGGLRLQEDLIIGIVGDRATRCDCRESCAAAGPQHVVDGVVVDECAVAATTRAVAFRQHLHDFVEFLACQIPVGIGTTDHRKELFLVPLSRRYLGDNLLGQHVERPSGDSQTIELAAPDRIQQCRAFGQIIPGQRKQPPLGRAAHGVA